MSFDFELTVVSQFDFVSKGRSFISLSSAQRMGAASASFRFSASAAIARLKHYPNSSA
jgi:hypothetical protein